jgi:hypothetical protein
MRGHLVGFIPECVEFGAHATLDEDGKEIEHRCPVELPRGSHDGALDRSTVEARIAV